MLYLCLSPPFSSLPPSVPPSLFNKLQQHSPQRCSRLLGEPLGPVARRRRHHHQRLEQWRSTRGFDELHILLT